MEILAGGLHPRGSVLRRCPPPAFCSCPKLSLFVNAREPGQMCKTISVGQQKRRADAIRSCPRGFSAAHWRLVMGMVAHQSRPARRPQSPKYPFNKRRKAGELTVAREVRDISNMFRGSNVPWAARSSGRNLWSAQASRDIYLHNAVLKVTGPDFTASLTNFDCNGCFSDSPLSLQLNWTCLLSGDDRTHHECKITKRTGLTHCWLKIK